MFSLYFTACFELNSGCEYSPSYTCGGGYLSSDSNDVSYPQMLCPSWYFIIIEDSLRFKKKKKKSIITMMILPETCISDINNVFFF